MTDKEKKQKENQAAFLDFATNYWRVFSYFHKTSNGNTSLAARLTHDMFSAMVGQNKQDEKKTEIPPGFFDMTKGGPLS